jgi:membrane-associated protease RseP (regulator of RpoE activity)
VGAEYHRAFASGFDAAADLPLVAWNGLWYSLTVLTILGVHELGHYYACRRYRVDASLPYFLPAPILIGTLGAFIRIRQPIPTKRLLFDIGVAGPIAGFVVAVPALFIGVALSEVLPLPGDFGEFALVFGEPLLFRLAAWTIWGAFPEGYSLNLHPMGFAAWVGLLATALNLFPIGQLDGGHISYAVFGARSTLVTLASAAVLFALAFHSPSWIVWAVLMVVMLVTLGPRHPRTLDHDVPIDRTRMLVAGFALVIFVLCFTPAPIQIIGELGQ